MGAHKWLEAHPVVKVIVWVTFVANVAAAVDGGLKYKTFPKFLVVFFNYFKLKYCRRRT